MGEVESKCTKWISYDPFVRDMDKSQKGKDDENNKPINGNENKETNLYDVLSENVTAVKSDVFISQVEKLALEKNNKTSVPPILNNIQTNDIRLLDESNELISTSQETNKEKKDWSVIGALSNSIVSEGTKNIRPESSVCLKNQKSVSYRKAINNTSVDTVDGTADLQILYEKDVLVKSESVQNVNELASTQLIFHAKSCFDMSQTGQPSTGNKTFPETDSNIGKHSNKDFKEQDKVNCGTSFLLFCSFFHFFKSSNENTEKIYFRNNEIEFRENDPIKFQHNIVTKNLLCCPLSTQQGSHPEVDTKHCLNDMVYQSSKSKDKVMFPNVQQMINSESSGCQNSSLMRLDSSFKTSKDIAALASPEVISYTGSELSSPNLSSDSINGISHDKCRASDSKDSFYGSNFSSPLALKCTIPQAKLKLLHEGDVQVCYFNHARTIVDKVLSSKFLKRWETHHIYLTSDSICSKTPIGFLESAVPYSNLDDIYVLGKWDRRNRFCLRLVMADGSLLLQASNPHVRHRWFFSILWKKNMHKYRNILETSTRPEVIVKEIKSLIYWSLNTPLYDNCIRNVPIEIISKLLGEFYCLLLIILVFSDLPLKMRVVDKVVKHLAGDEIWNDRLRCEEIIIALAPLLEDSTPSTEMFQFFSRLCLRHPRSPVVVDIFTAIVHRVLLRTDFSKTSLMGRFVADYLKALLSQNDGDEAVRKFVASIHGPISSCPHPRVLPNLVAVNLAAIFSHFEQKKMLLTESANEMNCPQAVQILDSQLECYITLFLTISEFEDWRPGLAQILQPIPFPDDALSQDVFIKSFTPIIQKIGTDLRCDTHEMVLGIGENKESWLNVFCPSSLVCTDEGVLWCQMLKTLFSCCCRRKSFLQKMIKHLGSLLLVALRNDAVAQEMLCLMLEWRLIEKKDQEMEVVKTLQSTESGCEKYRKLCKKQERIKELQKKGGPKKLALPNCSTDADVARLLSCGSFGNLECLTLAFTRVTSMCAHELIHLPSLRNLNLWATQFGDAGLIIIAEHLDKLQALNLCETPVSDKGIIAIAEMKSLKKLNLNSTKLSLQTLNVLKQKLSTLQELDVRYTDAW